jgi:hypothetical protein
MLIAALLLVLQPPPPGEAQRPRESAGERMQAELAPAEDPYAQAARAWGDCVRVRAGEAAAAGTAEAPAVEAGLADCAAEEAAMRAVWEQELGAARAERVMAEYRQVQRESALRYIRQLGRER